MTAKANHREQATIDKYESQGYEVLTKGWPDLLCFKDGKAVLVEVKRTQRRPTKKMGLSKHQRRVIDILREIGLDVRVEYVD